MTTEQMSTQVAEAQRKGPTAKKRYVDVSKHPGLMDDPDVVDVGKLEGENAELRKRLSKFLNPDWITFKHSGYPILGLSGANLREVPIAIPETAYKFLKEWMHEDPKSWFEARLYEAIIGVLEQVSLPKMKELERRRKLALDTTKSEYKELEGEEYP